jgi:hypothetical protein
MNYPLIFRRTYGGRVREYVYVCSPAYNCLVYVAGVHVHGVHQSVFCFPGVLLSTPRGYVTPQYTGLGSRFLGTPC